MDINAGTVTDVGNDTEMNKDTDTGVVVNSLAPGRFEWNFRLVILKIISVIGSWGISCEIALRWMSLGIYS